MGAPVSMDLDWAITSGGELTSAHRRALTLALVRSLPGVIAGQIALATGRRGDGRVPFHGLTLPTTDLAAAAEQTARECLAPHVLEHSYRTYFFGRALCELQGVTFDDEIAYVSSLLHDLNLENPTPGRCFAVTGAERAMEFAVANGATADRAHAIGATIAGHVTVGIAEEVGTVGFVSAGAAVDVVGDRLADMDPGWVLDLIARHPRLEFKRHMITALQNEAAAVPGGRTQWLLTRAAFRQLIRRAPFAE